MVVNGLVPSPVMSVAYGIRHGARTVGAGCWIQKQKMQDRSQNRSQKFKMDEKVYDGKKGQKDGAGKKRWCRRKNAAHPDAPDSTALAIVGTESHEPVRIVWIGYRFLRISGGIYKQAGYDVDGIDPAPDFGQKLLLEGVPFG